MSRTCFAAPARLTPTLAVARKIPELGDVARTEPIEDRRHG